MFVVALAGLLTPGTPALWHCGQGCHRHGAGKILGFLMVC